MKKNYTYALITVFIWSTMAAVVKKTLIDIPNLEALSVSSFSGVIFLFLMNWKSGRIKELRNYRGKAILTIMGLGFIGMFLYSALYYYGLSKLTSQEACIVNYLWPIMLVLFSCILLKEKMTFLKGFAMVCSFAGILILSLGNTGEALGANIWGIVSCAVAAACYGLFCVLNKKHDYDQNLVMMITWLVAAVGAMIVGLLTENWVPIRGTSWIGILWIGIMSHAVAYLLWALALQGTENTAKIANLAYLTPFLSLIVSSVLLGEKITLRALVALIFIVGGILLQSFFDRTRKKCNICDS